MLFDLHCDTLLAAYKSKETIISGDRGVSVEKFSRYTKKAQVLAVWSDRTLSDDECYLNFRHIATDLQNQIEQNSELLSLCKTSEELKNAVDAGKLAAILAVEDARLLAGDLSRLETLYEAGVRILTLAWKGKTVIGGGFDTEEPLTKFGIEVVKECENLGITVDVSHLSEKGFYDVASHATKPFIASHSNSRALCDHPRNLSDIQARTVFASGGIVGVNLVKDHLSPIFSDKKMLTEAAVLEFVSEHLEHFYNISPQSICLGLDLDGTMPLPGLEGVDKAQKLFEALTNRGMDEKSAEDVFFNNAYNFFLNNL